MTSKRKSLGEFFRCLLVMFCTFAIVAGDTMAYMPSPRSAQAPAPQDQAAKIPPDQLDSLVAPIALYPDPMLAQSLAIADAVEKQPWDPRLYNPDKSWRPVREE